MKLPKHINKKIDRINKLYREIEEEAQDIQDWAEKKYGLDEIADDQNCWDIHMWMCTYDPAPRTDYMVIGCIEDSLKRKEEEE